MDYYTGQPGARYGLRGRFRLSSAAGRVASVRIENPRELKGDLSQLKRERNLADDGLAEIGGKFV